MKGKSEVSNFIGERVSIKLEGFKPEKLLSQAAAKGVRIRNVVYKDETEIHLTVSREGVDTLKKLAGSTHRLTVIERRGARVRAYRMKKSKMTIAGICLFLLFFSAQSLFVREIKVIGCKSITESSIREAIAEEGLYEGARRNFDCDAIERMLFETFDEIVWARVAYDGGYAEVHISESRQAPVSEENRDVPCNIVAEKDCYIERIYTYRGRAKAVANDFVRKGDILITGKIPVEHPSYPVKEGKKLYHYAHAEGKIVARVPYYFSFYMPPVSSGEGTDDISKNTETEAPLEKGKARERKAEAMLRRWIKENIPKQAEILKKDFHFDEKKNIIRVYGTIETRQQVGTEKEIVIDKHKRRTEKDTD